MSPDCSFPMMHCRSRVLVVEDDPDVRQSLCDYLESLGCQVTGARNGLEGLAAIQDGVAPCLAFVDVDMPKLDGHGFAERVRERAELAGVPMISMSASGEALSGRGVAQHLAKPFDTSAIDAVVRRWCANRGRGSD